MAAVGRILQVVGWVWVAVGLFGSMVGLPDLNFFPGIVLVFLSRALGRQARRNEPDELAADTAPLPERQLNTERVQTQEPAPSPRAQGLARPVETTAKPSGQPSPPEERNEILERILAAGSDVAGDSRPAEPEESSLEAGQPMTSAEMIAQARKRWNTRP